MHTVSLKDRLRYAFDNTVSRGVVALIGWLALISAGLIVLIALLVWVTGVAPDYSLPELMWMGLMRTLDAGTMGGDQGSLPFLLAMLAVTLGGIFVVSTLIGILTTGLEARLEALRKGRSRVIETGHTVILGWSQQVFSIISELSIANANRPRACIVVLGDHDKVEMEDEIREKVGPTGRTRIVCRTGSPLEMADLEIVSLPTARSVIVPGSTGNQGDAEVIKTLLAMTNDPQRSARPYHIVAAIRNRENLEAARLAGSDQAEIVVVSDLIARIVAQTCRQSGLSSVYGDLLDFAGDEIYFKEEPALVGKSFGDALFAYEDSAVLGIWPRNGQPKLNPPMDQRIAEGDQLIVISTDDDTIRLSGRTDWSIRGEAIRPPAEVHPVPERTLVLGWNRRGPAIIRELDSYVAPGSVLTVVAGLPADEIQGACGCQELRNQAVTIRSGDTTDRAVLDSLAIPTYQHVIVLCYSDIMEAQQADASTLITLLHLRDIAGRHGHPFSITSEMLDIRNRNLAEVTRADDFIVSDRLVSLVLAQVSEHKVLNAVFADLFDPQGSEIYLKPIADYVRLDEPLSFYTLLEAARRRGEVAIGYRIAAHANDKARNYGVVLNPAKSQPVAFVEADRLIVLAER